MSWNTTPPIYAPHWSRWIATADRAAQRLSDEWRPVWGGYGPSLREEALNLLHGMRTLCLPYPSPGRPLADDVTMFPDAPPGRLPGEREVRAIAARVVRILAHRTPVRAVQA